MSRRTAKGICRLCLQHRDLTFEHVPPKSALNRSRAGVTVFAEWLDAEEAGRSPRQAIMQGGIGRHTLCAPCNNNTGKWYVPAFADWCVEAHRIMEITGGRPRLIPVKRVYPLRILKQVLVMFCSVAGPQLVGDFPDLKRFLLNRESRELPDGLRVFSYYNVEGKLRYIPTTIRGVGGRAAALAEITFPPFGYVLTFGAGAPHAEMGELTPFHRHSYFATAELRMGLPVLPTHSPMPGDYRTREEFDGETADARRAMERIRRRNR